MTKSLANQSQVAALNLEKVLIQGDLSPLSVEERLNYVNKVAKAIGINPLLRPFDYIAFHGKTVLYANRACTEQLRMRYHVSIKIVNRERTQDMYIVTAQAITGKGKLDESIGAVSVRGLTGEALANALMKAETKAKRRVTLSICGLGILDEIEAKDLAEREVKETDEATAAEIESKIEGTVERPEFEGVGSPIHPEQTTPTETTTDYILKAGKHKGKKISALTVKQREVWLKYYDKMLKEDKLDKLDPDIDSDLRAIIDFMDESKLTAEESKDE